MKTGINYRINALANKSKIEGLTEEEKIEQQKLRKNIWQLFVKNFKKQLDNIEIDYVD